MVKTKKEFEDFYNNHFDKVYRFIFFRVGANKAVAEDLVSEIFIKALEHFDSFDPARGQSAWIFTIALNHLKNYWRDQKPAVALPDAAEEENGINADKNWLKPALQLMDKNMAKAEAIGLIAKLDSEVDREIVTFHYLFGYNYNEIANILAMTESAVKTAAHRAVHKLRKLV